MMDTESRTGAVRPHPRRISAWVEFRPGLRDRHAGVCCQRAVRCTVCDVELGTATDPVEAMLVARRHRREVRAAAWR